MKMFEYMASGRPIISSHLPVLMEVLNHESNALLVDPEDRSEWLTTVELLKQDEQLRLILGENAFKDVTNYTWRVRSKMILSNI
jgi:glycosyltransferase involved in cell wall biosynthesis